MLALQKIKNILWPIERGEHKLFLPMAMLMFCVLCNFCALRSVKDGLVVPSIGAEAISFLKVWLVLPSALLMTICYVMLSNRMNFERLFYLIVSTFLAFFVFFAFIIYPNETNYHPAVETILYYEQLAPNFKWFFRLASKWSYALMYVFSELWSVVVINLMFWQFANNIISTSTAKRFYPTLAMIGNLGLIFSGNIILICTNPASWIVKTCASIWSMSPDELSLKLIITMILCIGIIAMLLLHHINKNLGNITYINKENYNHHTTSLSLIESIRLVCSSKYIGYILIMVICYGLVINVLEGPWKDKVAKLYPEKMAYVAFMGQFNIYMGISCVVFTIIGSNILRSSGWFIAAIMTPLMMGITGALFFIFVIWGSLFDHSFIGDFNPLYAAVLAGAAQNILSKSTKYSLFDSTKEMAYIPLSVELRTKGKAAAEIVGAKLGKSLGAIVQSMIFIIWPNATFDSITPILLGVFCVVIIIWFLDLTKLNQEYHRLQHD